MTEYHGISIYFVACCCVLCNKMHAYFEERLNRSGFRQLLQLHHLWQVSNGAPSCQGRNVTEKERERVGKIMNNHSTNKVEELLWLCSQCISQFPKEMLENMDEYGIAHASIGFSSHPSRQLIFLLAEWSVLWPPASAWLAHFATAVAKATTAVPRLPIIQTSEDSSAASAAKSGPWNEEEYHGNPWTPYWNSLSLSIAISGKPAVKLKAS